MASLGSTTPSISVQVAIDRPVFRLGGSQARPSIFIVAVSHASQLITIFTWPTVFNLSLSQKRYNFTCLDLTTGTPLHLETTKGPKRPGFSRTRDGLDDKYFCTLEPEIPVLFEAPFLLATRISTGENAIMEGHSYRFSVREGETVQWWWYGKKEDILAPPGQYATLEPASGEPIKLGKVESINFKVER
jgi:hypothetical protein